MLFKYKYHKNGEQIENDDENNLTYRFFPLIQYLLGNGSELNRSANNLIVLRKRKYNKRKSREQTSKLRTLNFYATVHQLG